MPYMTVGGVALGLEELATGVTWLQRELGRTGLRGGLQGGPDRLNLTG